MRGNLGNKQRLQHIIKAIMEIESFIEEATYDDFNANRMMQQACVRNLEIIGEASNHLSSELKNKYSTIDWSGVKGFRNLIIHEYFKVNNQLVWRTIQTNLPDFKQKILGILSDLSE